MHVPATVNSAINEFLFGGQPALAAMELDEDAF